VEEAGAARANLSFVDETRQEKYLLQQLFLIFTDDSVHCLRGWMKKQPQILHFVQDDTLDFW
jgi:hypothetical protein